MAAPTASPAAPAVAIRPPASRARPRLGFVDNLRVALIALVVAHHAGQPYGPTGGAWPLFDARQAPILGAFFTVNASLGMGLFFLLAAYFLPASYDRKGARAFLRDRALRLGLPLLLGTLLMFVPAFYVTEGRASGGPLAFCRAFALAFFGPWHLGHLWFLADLLAYTAAYALWRRLAARATAESRAAPGLPGTPAILLGIMALGLATFVVRVWFPIDRWTALPWPLPLEPAHLPQYVGLFVVGLRAARGDWFRRFPTARGLAWLGVGLVAAALPYAYVLGALPLPAGLLTGGGASWGALARSLWEAILAAALAIGLVVLFRDHAGRRGRLLRALAADVYAVYLIHIPIILGLQAALVGAALPPLVKFGLVALAGVPLCFLAAEGLRRLPGLRGGL